MNDISAMDCTAEQSTRFMGPPVMGAVDEKPSQKPSYLTQTSDLNNYRSPAFSARSRSKESTDEHEASDAGESADLNRLLCNESLSKEELFHANENSPHSEKNHAKSTTTSAVKAAPSRSKPVVKRGAKTKTPNTVTPITTQRHEKEKKTDKSSTSPLKRRQPRTKKVVEEPVHQEIVEVDEQSVVSLKDVVGDLEFEDLEPEDLEIVRYLPPPGNIQIVGNCSESLAKLRDFERTLQDILHGETKKNSDNDQEHDSDATISIVSEEGQGIYHSATNPTLDSAMLMAYKIVFDPPVPAVITIPTSIVQVRSVDDWETESKALQYLLKKSSERPVPSRSGKSRKRKRHLRNHDPKTDEYVKRLISAIEIKSNQVVHLKRPVFSLQHPLQSQSTNRSVAKNTVFVEEPKKESPPIAAVAPRNQDSIKKNKVLIEKLDLDPLCMEFLEASLDSIQPAQEKELRKAVKQWKTVEDVWRRKLAYSDQSCYRDLHDTISDVQKGLRQLSCNKERSIAVAHEKYILDVDEIEKRTNSSTEKAKSHVTNMFEENRRQFDLQKTLDFATCKCDMLAINTRNMRRRADVQPQYARLFEDIPLSNTNMGTPGSPPHNMQSNMPMQNSHSVKRRRNNFASTLKEQLEDTEIYADLANINRVLKEDPDRARMTSKSAEVIPDHNRLTIDGKAFHRNQEILVEHFEQGKYPGLLLQFTQTEIMLKRTVDGQRLRFPLGLLMDKKLVLRKRSSAVRGNPGSINK